MNLNNQRFHHMHVEHALAPNMNFEHEFRTCILNMHFNHTCILNMEKHACYMHLPPIGSDAVEEITTVTIQ
jgi:hypothetical protein